MSNDLFSPPTTNVLQALAGYHRPSTLTAAQKLQISILLGQKLGKRPCDMCGEFSWAIGDNLVGPLPLLINHATANYSTDYGMALPSVHLICSNCGNTKLFLVSQLGFNPFAPE